MTNLFVEDDAAELMGPAEAVYPLEFVQGLVQAIALMNIAEGETAIGHQRYRPITDEEVISRSFSLAERVYEEAAKRGWGTWNRPSDGPDRRQS